MRKVGGRKVGSTKAPHHLPDAVVQHSHLIPINLLAVALARVVLRKGFGGQTQSFCKLRLTPLTPGIGKAPELVAQRVVLRETRIASSNNLRIDCRVGSRLGPAK